MNGSLTARVAVVMPVYNAAHFIEQTLASVRAQTFCDHVVVAVNDGSTDDSAAILQRLRDDRLLVIDQPNSGGPARPRNVGTRATSCEYVAFFDSDDLMDPDKLRLQVGVLDRCKDAAFAFSDFGIIDEAGCPLFPSFLSRIESLQRLVASCPGAEDHSFIPQERLFSGLCRANFVGTSSAVVRRSALDAVGGFDESLRNSDDRDMWFRLARKFGAAYVPRVLHQYRKRKGGITSRGAARNAESRIRVLRRQIEMGVSAGDRRELLKWIAGHHRSAAYAERDAGNRRASVESFLRAFAVKPDLRYLLAAARSVVHVNR